MSESKRLSGDDNLSEIETMLLALAPETLAVDRDQFFYRAGYAAAKAAIVPSTRRLWLTKVSPVAAAALLFIGVGLGLAYYRQSVDVRDLRTALAGAIQEKEGQAHSRGRVSPRREVVANDFAESAQEPLADLPRVSERRDHVEEPFAQNQRSRELQRLASAQPLPPGRLTALGWRKLSPEEIDAMAREASQPAEDARRPQSQRANTYWELLRQLES